MPTTEARPRTSEPTGRPDPPTPPPVSPALLRRLRLAAVSTLLAAVAFVQDPGRVAADTKLDLYVDPGGFLAKAMHLWEPLGFFGQLQNQAYGYLFPMGPFYLVGGLTGMPAWVVQRLWWSLLLIAAFLGAAQLARMLGVRGDLAAIASGLAYALAPRMVTEIAVVSVEALPFAVAPWVVIPLVSRTLTSPRRAAALSGVAILCAGGVNAVATAALIPLGAWWILTRFRGRQRLRIGGWWMLAVALATLWWAIPLVTLGRYSPPFLDWIESSSITSLVTSPDTVLRGTSQWVAYVVDSGGVVWPGGWPLVSMPVLIVATGAVAALGLTGLALRSTPYRVFLLGVFLFGFVAVSLGHTGDVQGIAAEPMRALLDGVLAPLRNTHKFDLLMRLPLAMGVGFLAQALLRRGSPVERQEVTSPDSSLPVGSVWRPAMAIGLVGVILLSAWPALTGVLTRDRSFVDIPSYWTDVARWLQQAQPAGRALLVPGASFGVYSWGRTQDEPLQPLAMTPWGVRDAVPLTSAGNIRWLDAIQERLDAGRGTPGLADALARHGIRYLVLRNDIDQRRSETPRTVLIRQALIRSGGFRTVAGFGPSLPPYRTATTVVDGGLQDATAAVEIWQVESPYAPTDSRAWLRHASSVLVTSGSAESAVDLLDTSQLGTGALVTAGDEAPLESAAGVTLRYGVTDGFPRTEVNVGRARNNRSQVMSTGQAFIQQRRVYDYNPVDPEGRQAVAEFQGGTVTASSSGSEPTALRGRSAAAQPWAALDGDGYTAWVSGELDSGVGQWWEVTTDTPFSATTIPIRLMLGDVEGSEPTRITVTTDAGEVTVPVRATGVEQSVRLPPGETRRLRLTLAAVADGSQGEGFGISEVTLPVEVGRTVRTAGAVDGGPIVLTARRGEQSGCASVGGNLACSAALGRPGEERSGVRRVVTVAEPGDFRVRVMVRPRPGVGLDRLLRPIVTNAPRATGSSVAASDPATRPQAAIDGVLSTAWIASPFDSKPELLLRWGEPRNVRGVRLSIAPDLAASLPLTVTLTMNQIETTGVVSDRGIIRVPAQMTTSLGIRFENSVTVRSLDPVTGQYVRLPLGVSEVAILGGGDLLTGPRLFDQVSVPCGFGPDVVIDGVPTLETTVGATVSEALTDALLPAAPCGGRVVKLDAGEHAIDVMSTDQFAVESVVLEPIAAQLASTSQRTLDDADIERWDATERDLIVAPADAPRLLETGENANAGWVATAGGVELTPVRVDGWRQAWLVPAGVGGDIALRFAPDGTYRLGLGLGLVAALVLAALAAWPVRRRTGQAAVGDARLDGQPHGGSTAAALALVGGGLVAAVLVAGLPGLATGVVAAAAAYAWRRPIVTLVLAAGAAVAAAAMPWPSTLSAPAWLTIAAGLLAVGAVSAATAPSRSRVDEADATTPAGAVRR